MDRLETARAIFDELSEAFRDLDEAGTVKVLDVSAPTELTPTTSFHVTLQAGSAAAVALALPATLAIGYLADEEAAVDEWRHWVHQAWQALQR